MNFDPRKGNSRYYDLDEDPLGDVPFYLNLVSGSVRVLEMGCGTGRVLAPLSKKCSEIIGVDSSKEMVERCREKIAVGGLKNASAQIGDITKLALSKKFDLVVAPYRVLQALESKTEIDGLFETIRSHLRPTGSCVLNVFNPNRPREELIATWQKPGEIPAWEKTLDDGSVVIHTEKYHRMDKVNLVLYPELIYRTYYGGVLKHEFVQKIKMKCYYPDEFRSLVTSHGFEIVGEWGGYDGQKYGEGPELVLQFKKPIEAY
ncbi:MAG: class I SAM-dependent methyltransferase [Bdellovibrionia bacterium]